MIWDEEQYEAKTPEERFAKNTKLVYFLANKLNVPESEFDDIIQEGMIGLFKAANTFREEKNRRFTTYASRCIWNEMLMYLRGVRKRENIISLDYTLGEDDEGKEITLEDRLSDPSSNIEKILESKFNLANCISIILNCLNPLQRSSLLCLIAGYRQEEIANMHCISQSYVSRIISKAQTELKKLLESNQSSKITFEVEVLDKMYVVSYKVEDLEKANKMLTDLSEECRDKKEFKYEIDDANKVIHLYFMLDIESFTILAKFVRKFEDVI